MAEGSASSRPLYISALMFFLVLVMFLQYRSSNGTRSVVLEERMIQQSIADQDPIREAQLHMRAPQRQTSKNEDTNAPPPPPPTRPPPARPPKLVTQNWRALPLQDIQSSASPDALCELNLLYSGNCCIEQGEEDYRACARRLGPERVSTILSTKCTDSLHWRDLLASNSTFSSSVETPPILKRGVIFDAQRFDPNPRRIPAIERDIGQHAPPRVCRHVGHPCKVYPVGFGIPRANFVDKVSRLKLFDFLPYRPGTFPFGGFPNYALKYEEEWLAHTLHKHSYFAFTHKRGGWDCMRHHEIIAAGAIPYFADLEICPKSTLSTLPRSLILEAMSLQGVRHIGRIRRTDESLENDFLTRRAHGHVNFKKNGDIDHSVFNTTRYFELADQILAHAKRHMTTASTVAYMLKTIGVDEPKHVLLIGRWTYDYLHQSIETGFSDLGILTTSVGHAPEWTLMQEDWTKRNFTEADLEKRRLEKWKAGEGGGTLPGNGWFYGFRTNPKVVHHHGVSRHDARFSQMIQGGHFDLIIYTFIENWPVSAYPYISAARTGSKHLAWVHHNDDHGDHDVGSSNACTLGTVFKREMHDTTC